MFRRKHKDSRKVQSVEERESALALRPKHRGTQRIGAQAIGALAIGAVTFGALAVGALAIGRLVISRARIRRLEIEELIVDNLRFRKRSVTDETEPSKTLRTDG
jgi:hypothetical protein